MALSRVGACVIVSLANPGGFHEIMPVIASGGREIGTLFARHPLSSLSYGGWSRGRTVRQLNKDFTSCSSLFKDHLTFFKSKLYHSDFSKFADSLFGINPDLHYLK